MNIIRPGEARYPIFREMAARLDRQPIGVELVDPNRVTGSYSRNIGANATPACIVFDYRVVDAIAFTIGSWSRTNLPALEHEIVRDVFGAYVRSLSMWVHPDADKNEVARALLEELCDEGIIGRVFIKRFTGEDDWMYRMRSDQNHWSVDLQELAVWRAARYLVLEDNG